ncbi:MAG TPA: ATP-binding protein [Candidatus Methylomirabilis sp.]|jgi:signal transduction histidine kinase
MDERDVRRMRVLRAAPVFGVLPEESLREVTASLQEETYAPGAVIFAEGDEGRDLYLLQSGTVRITVRGSDPESPPVRVVEAPDWFGELSLLTRAPRSATVTAAAGVTLWRLAGEVFDRLLERHPELAHALIQMLCARVWEKDREFLDQSALALSHARLSRELEEKKRLLEEAGRHKSAFLARMSHELRTPLNAIIGFAEVLLDGGLAPSEAERREFLGHILASGRHLLGLINEALDLSRIEAGRMDLRRSRVDLGALIEEVAAAAKVLAGKKPIRISHAAAAGLPPAWADPARVRQVLLNLVGNAVKFTPAGGEIAIRARRSAGAAGGQGSRGAEESGGWVEISVADSGIGIAPEEQGRIFEEFRQVPGAESAGQGTGLGLAVARRLVELHGGAIGVESAPGQGSTFTFTLPVQAPADAAARD